MENFKVENLSFTYPNKETKTLNNINITVNSGEFITICGKSGCGKTTLLRMLKSVLTPFGKAEGRIYFEGKPLADCSKREQTEKIGFVMQNPENGIVTDKVWHELAFGLESLGFSTSEIRVRVAEMASFFGIQTWFYKNVGELSGGQKQLLNLAAVMVMQPEVLILDEPTSRLDPIAAQDFLKTLEKINRELGISVILAEHRLEEAFPISDRVIVMNDGRIIADSPPGEVCDILKTASDDMYSALPTPMRVYGATEGSGKYPLTIRDGRKWLEEYFDSHTINTSLIPTAKLSDSNGDCIIEIKNAWFRYEKKSEDIIKGLNLKVKKNELFTILGGNGAGKTTALSLISGLNAPYRGEILIKGKNISKIKNLYNGLLGVLPQEVKSVFLKKTVLLDLEEALSECGLSREEKDEMIKNVSCLCRIEELLESHPYDLSGGEQQRAALAKILLQNPEILILDEPTKGMDAHFKKEFAEILADLKKNGVTVVMVSHDIEFCAEYADRCAMFFDGNITSLSEPREFFSGKTFYTTAANRMARTTLKTAVLAEDIILALGGKIPKKQEKIRTAKYPEKKAEISAATNKLSPLRIIFGSLFALLFLITSVLFAETDILKAGAGKSLIFGGVVVFEVAAAMFCFFPSRGFAVTAWQKSEQRISKRTLAAAGLILLAVPITLYIGTAVLENKKYYFISLLMIFEIMIPFFMIFESRKPEAKEIVIISVLCTIAVAGRAAFFMIPQFKPVVAIIIISGVCFGGETGFLVGAITGFISNFFFGQGPWTPWQMFAFGIIGFFAGVLFQKGFLKKTRLSLCIFGFLATLLIYGGIMNPASVIMWQKKITYEMLVSSYAVGIPFDFIHSVSTVFFLWFISEPMIDKLERVKVKYGLIKR